MTWFWLALSSAVFLATADLIVKRHFVDLPLRQVVAARFAGLAPACAVMLALVEWPPLDATFALAVTLALPAEIAATFLYLRAIQLSPLALSTPFLSCTPLFVLGTGLVVLGEVPSVAGLCGVVLLAAGGYGLNLHQARRGWAMPLLMVRREPGSWMMLTVSLLYAYTSVMGKLAIMHSSPFFMGGFYPLLLAAVLLAVMAPGGLGWDWLKRPGPALALGLCMAGMVVCHFVAISQIQAAYMIAVKRTSPLFAVLYGGLLLGEARLAQHLLASGLMVAGSVFIALWG